MGMAIATAYHDALYTFGQREDALREPLNRAEAAVANAQAEWIEVQVLREYYVSSQERNFYISVINEAKVEREKVRRERRVALEWEKRALLAFYEVQSGYDKQELADFLASVETGGRKLREVEVGIEDDLKWYEKNLGIG